MKVMVVDDKDDARDIRVAVIELLGHSAFGAPNGRTALSLVDQISPEVIVCDIGLPNISGYDLVKRLREALFSYRLYTFALTGYTQPNDRERALAEGFDAVYSKQMEIDEMSSLLQSLIDTSDKSTLPVDRSGSAM